MIKIYSAICLEITRCWCIIWQTLLCCAYWDYSTLAWQRLLCCAYWDYSTLVWQRFGYMFGDGFYLLVAMFSKLLLRNLCFFNYLEFWSCSWFLLIYKVLNLQWECEIFHLKLFSYEIIPLARFFSPLFSLNFSTR